MRCLPGDEEEGDAAVERDGSLKHIHCTEVNLGEDSELVNRISKVRTIPCLILFTKSDDKWQKRELTGMQGQKSVKAFLSKYATPTVANRPAAASTR